MKNGGFWIGAEIDGMLISRGCRVLHHATNSTYRGPKWTTKTAVYGPSKSGDFRQKTRAQIDLKR